MSNNTLITTRWFAKELARQLMIADPSWNRPVIVDGSEPAMMPEWEGNTPQAFALPPIALASVEGASQLARQMAKHYLAAALRETTPTP